MSGIMCKCGHEAHQHDDGFGCYYLADSDSGVRCSCEVTRSEIEAEQTSEIERLTVENATLRAENARLADEAERLRNTAGKNKLYVWKDVLTDYTSGVMFAIAPDIEAARKTVIEEEKKVNGGYASQYMADELSKEPEIIDVSAAYAYSVWGGG